MKHTAIMLTALLILILAACSAAPAQEPQPAPFAEAGEPSEAPPAEPAMEPTSVDMVDSQQLKPIAPEQISLDTQGLPYSWQAITVPEQPYDESQPPGPEGLPEHIEILFGAGDATERDPSAPIMYLIPVDAYREMWDLAGNDYVSRTIDDIKKIAQTMTPPEGSRGLPALPSKEFVGANDIAVQFGRALPAGAAKRASATQTGYRFVGRWAQDANPVTNANLRYVYQGFTNDGRYLVSFWYPVTSAQIADEPTSEAWEQINEDIEAYLAAEAERLDALATNDWEPDLTTLDALVASLQIEGMSPGDLGQ